MREKQIYLFFRSEESNVVLKFNMILKSKNVTLRPLSLADAPRFCKWLKDPQLTKFLSMHDHPAPTLKEEREWIKARQRDKKSVTFAIETAEGVHIGSISLRGIDSPDRRALFGIVIGDQQYWGQGYGTEAGRMLVDYGFRKLKLNRIYLEHIAYNTRGHQSYEKIGFKEEGIFREHTFRDGYFHDVVWMGILRKNYLKKVKKK